VGQEEILTLRGSPDRAVRQAATESLYEGLKRILWQTTYITNTLSLDNANDDDLRHMPGPVEGMNIMNNIDNDIVEAMNQAVNRAYPRVSHRYYELKRRILGLPVLKGWDRNAPLQTEEETKIPFDEAKAMVLESYNSFSSRMGQIAQRFFDGRWIDARVTEGKRTGAFASENSVDTHPVVFVNYLGSPRDIATLAHELGHGIHMVLAAEHLKSELAARTPLTIAETASVFGERVTFENLLACETDPQKRIIMLAGKINDMVNTVVRQNAFFNFEKEVHAARKSEGRDLESGEINAIYLKTQKEALGPAFDLDEDYGLEWSYIPHFIHHPYYVYSYVFGDCLVNSLYRKYQEAADKPAFAEKYIRMLEAGGSKPATELVTEFGLDLRDPAFWDGGMKAVEELIDQLEREIDSQKKPVPAAVSAPSTPSTP
jgi:oligoendopeptidase F